MPEPSHQPAHSARSILLQTIAASSPVSRAELSRITQLSKQTVSDSVARLESHGWVRTIGQSAGHVGRRAAVYEITPGSGLLASADLGGTKLRIQISDLSGTALNETRVATTQDGGPALVEQIATTLSDTVMAAGLPPEALLCLCIGVPGAPQPDSGQILLAPNIAGLDGFDFIGSLKHRLGIDVLVENDVNLAAIGENQNIDTVDPLLYLAIGTGIGAGIVSQGQILRGANGAAGEIAYLPFGADPFEEDSLTQGALERVAASHALKRLYHDKTGQNRDVPDIFDAAETGEHAAMASLIALARQIARAIAAATAILDPGRVVIGGSIGAREILRDEIIAQLAKCSPRPVPVSPSSLGQYAPLIGGFSLARAHFYDSARYTRAAPYIARPEQPTETPS